MEFIPKVKRRGNSLWLIIPKYVVTALALNENSTFRLNFVKSGDKIFVTGTVL